MVYTDGIHIAAETLKELHEFASRVSIKRCWFYSDDRHPHYDKPKRFPLQALIAAGATFTRSREVLRISESAARATRRS